MDAQILAEINLLRTGLSKLAKSLAKELTKIDKRLKSLEEDQHSHDYDPDGEDD